VSRRSSAACRHLPIPPVVVVSDPDFAVDLLASLRAGLVAVDVAGRVSALNREAAELLGTPGADPEECLGLDCREVLAAQPRMAGLLLDCLAGQELPPRLELELQPMRGVGPRTVGLTVMPVRDALERLRGAAVLFRDLTPFEEQAEQVRLKERLAAVGSMAAGLAHELRTPLAGIEVVAGLLRRELAGDCAARELVDELLEASRRLSRVIREGLGFLRPAIPEREPVEPESLVFEAVDAARGGAAAEVEVVVRPGLPRLVADAGQLRSALSNLLRNAFEAAGASAAGGRVHLEVAEAPGGGLVFAVEDDGPGVPAELRDRIFQPFFTTREGGSGLGLAMAQKVAVAHGGSLTLGTGSLGGARFELRLPAGESKGEVHA